VLDVPLDEAQAPVQYPDLLMDERVGVGGEGDLRTGRQLDLDEFERAPGRRRHGPAPVAGVGSVQVG